jgi:hypothetical protein
MSSITPLLGLFSPRLLAFLAAVLLDHSDKERLDMHQHTVLSAVAMEASAIRLIVITRRGGDSEFYSPCGSVSCCCAILSDSLQLQRSQSGEHVRPVWPSNPQLTGSRLRLQDEVTFPWRYLPAKYMTYGATKDM